MKKLALLLLLFFTTVSGEDLQLEFNEKVPKCISGIVFVGEKRFLLDKKELEAIKGIQFKHIDDVPGSESDLRKLLAPNLNRPFNANTLKEIKQQIYQYYRKNDRPIILVIVPKQKEDTGTAQFIVKESTLGKLTVVGNKWSPSKRYENYFDLKPGEAISQRSINRDMDFVNRSPFRTVNVSYSPGTREYTTDVTLEVTDRKPYFFYMGCDNTGVPTTGRQRIFAGLGWDQIRGKDISFFYQYTTNYSAHRYHSNTFQFTAMCPWHAIINLYGGFSIVHATLHPMPLNNRGTNIQGSIRYIAPFLSSRFFSQELIAGFDLKNTNNTMEFTDTTPVFGQTVNISQWTVGYKCRYESKKMTISGGVETVFSPFQWLPGQTDADYESLRPGADNRWFYATAYCNIRNALPLSLTSHLRLAGEISPQTLLPSEQFGIGGHDTVRGYDERQYNGDSGMLVNWEVHTPGVALIRTKSLKGINQANLLAFFDGGFGFDNTKVPQIPYANVLASVGIGFRYFLSDLLKARVDYGVKLHHQADFTGGASEVHFNVTGSY